MLQYYNKILTKVSYSRLY